MNTTSATDTVIARAKLSCNHVIDIFDPEVVEGSKVVCTATRCTKGTMVRRSRRVKKLTPVTPAERTEAEADAADERVDAVVAEVLADRPELADEADAEGLVAEAIAEADAAAGTGMTEADVAAITDPTVAMNAAADAPAYDTLKARDEWNAVAAWRRDGQVGDAPATPNLDAMNAAHAAGTPKPATGKKATAPKKATSPRRAKANARKAAKERTAVKVTEDELARHIDRVLAEQGADAQKDELEYAYWVLGFAVSRNRWNTAWAAAMERAADKAPAAG